MGSSVELIWDNWGPDLLQTSTALGCTPCPEGPVSNILWSQKPLRVWFVKPESLNIGYLDSLGCKEMRTKFQEVVSFFAKSRWTPDLRRVARRESNATGPTILHVEALHSL